MTIDISFSIVGIANIIVDVEVLNHLYLTAPGKDVILRREPQNIVDIRAVEVLLDGKKIGYVRAHDVREYGLDHLLEHERGYSAKIIAKHPDYASFNALMQVNNAYLKPENNDSLEYAHWSYTGCTVDGTCVDEWNDLQNVMDSMHTLLDQGTANADNMQPLMDRYVMLAEYGFSCDFFEDRKQLYKKICDYKDEDVRSLSREMVSVSAYIHNSDVRAKAYSKILKAIKKELKKQGSAILDHYTANRIEKELEKFPKDLYNLKKKVAIFPSRLYYDQIPRKQMVKFLSGIALVAVLNAAEKAIKPQKNKRGKPKKQKRKETPIYYFLNGNRYGWIDYFKEKLEGKINEAAAAVLKAGCLTGVIDSYPAFNDFEETFGHIGNRNDFMKAFRTLDESNPMVNNHIELIKAAQVSIDNL